MLTRTLFTKTARALSIVFRGKTTLIEPRRFRTGSMGWRTSGEIIEVIGGEPCRCVFTLMVTVRGSKNWPEIVETNEEPVDLAWAEEENAEPPARGALAWQDDPVEVS